MSDKSNRNGFSGGGGTALAAASTSAPVYVNGTVDPLAVDLAGGLRVNIFGNQISNPPLDNITAVMSYTNVSTPPLLYVGMGIHGGTFSGTIDAVRRGFSKAKTPTVFRTISTAAAGNTVVWTPGVGNRFRLLKFRVQLTGNAALAVAAVLDITLNDAGGAMNLAHSAFVPAAALAGGGHDYDSGWIDLGFFGIFSAAANNVLNVNLSAALTTGVCRVMLAGVED